MRPPGGGIVPPQNHGIMPRPGHGTLIIIVCRTNNHHHHHFATCRRRFVFLPFIQVTLFAAAVLRFCRCRSEVCRPNSHRCHLATRRAPISRMAETKRRRGNVKKLPRGCQSLATADPRACGGRIKRIMGRVGLAKTVTVGVTVIAI